MPLATQRFAVRNSQGDRSSEWVVMWKDSDVYLAARTRAQSMKLSLHASGQCHVRTPKLASWLGTGDLPDFIDKWFIDVRASYQFPFSVVFPEQELRSGDWYRFPEKETIWIEAKPKGGIEVALFLVRAQGDITDSLRTSGWHTTIVDATLSDGRRLLVVAGDAAPPQEELAELEAIRKQIVNDLLPRVAPMANPRMVLNAGPDSNGVRKFVDVAGAT